MTITSRLRRSLRAAALLGVLALLLSTTVTLAAGPISIEARALVAGRYEPGGWLALSVTLSNDGAPVSGVLAADTTDGTVQRLVELPAGARKQVPLYLRPEPFQRKVTVRFEQDGSVTAAVDVEVKVLERGSGQVAVVGDGGGTLRPQLLARAQAGASEPLALSASDIPERPEPLRGIEAIVWASDSTGLSDAQRRSLERWIASGGQLIVLGGPDWQSRSAAFSDLLPIEPPSAFDDLETSNLTAWTGAETSVTGGLTAASGELRDGALGLVELDGDSGLPLLAIVSRGAGRVAYVAIDMATAPFRAWEGSSRLWARLLPQDQAAQQFGGGFPVEEEAANILSQALGSLPSLDVPPAELLLIVIVAYILLIGPVSYLVLRRMDRRELAWITAPVLVLIFSASSYGIGSSMKGSQVIVNEITVVRAASGGTAASVQTYAGIFSPNRATYDLTVDADALLAPFYAPAFDAGPVANRASYTGEQGDPAHLRGLAVSVFGFQSVRADAVISYEPALEVSWHVGESKVEGSVTNNGKVALDDVAIITPSSGKMIGDLAAGESKEFSLSTRNFNGNSVSDSVYGFMNFDQQGIPSDGLETMARRQVIDSLVGYGGWFPGKGTDFSLGLDRGPFIIGWQAAPGPISVEVDDETVERFSQTVEVVSGRPQLGPGPVRLEPSQLSVQVVSTDGDANQQEPGFVTLGNGEIVFGIALPLEAAKLAPTAVTLLVGSDPGMIMGNQGGMGFLPPGYTFAVREVDSGEWRDLGDLSQASTFEIDDPASVLDDAGRMEVRVTGTGVQDQFGQMSIFVGASLEGVAAP